MQEGRGQWTYYLWEFPPASTRLLVVVGLADVLHLDRNVKETPQRESQWDQNARPSSGVWTPEFKTSSATFLLSQPGQDASCFCASVSHFLILGGEGSAWLEEWRLIPQQTEHIKMTWNMLQHCHIGDENAFFKMPYQHYILSIKCNYNQEKWSRANWQSLCWFDIFPTYKERSIFYKYLLISVPHLSVWEIRLLGSFFVGSVHAGKVLPLYFWRGMHPAEQAMSPASLCAARQRKDLFLSGVKTAREPRSWRTRYAPSRVSGWLSQLSLLP